LFSVNFKQSFTAALLVMFANASVLADEVVEIHGTTVTCTGACTLIGGSSPGGSIGSGWGAAVYANNPNVGYNDGTRGEGNSYNRQPACQNEGYFMKDVMTSVALGNPVGRVIMTNFGDPQFQGYGWVKMTTSRITKVMTSPFVNMTLFNIEIHYMFNVQTLESTQYKIKTSFESGCLGIVKSVT